MWEVPFAAIVVSRSNFSCTLLAIDLAILRDIENLLGGNKFYEDRNPLVRTHSRSGCGTKYCILRPGKTAGWLATNSHNNYFVI
jgi:hypothetical protein